MSQAKYLEYEQGEVEVFVPVEASIVSNVSSRLCVNLLASIGKQCVQQQYKKH